jgi:cell fate regulator YaaT (PSP1 superfamily)
MCGQECCCCRFLSDYEKVSVKMAKNQNLSLNPQKISGVCGRLLCCLGYENEHYVETLKEMPKVGSKVDTPDGQGIVTYNNLLSKFVTVKIKTDDDSTILNQYDLKDIKIYEKNNVNEKLADEDIIDNE